MRFLASLIWQILAVTARLVIKKQQPIIIGITGSVGKTSTRNVIYKTLVSQFGEQNVYTPEGNYNGEWGLSLSILQQRTAGRNIFKWLFIFFK